MGTTAVVCSMVLTSAAHAEPQAANASTLAESLFDDATGLMDRGDYDRACPKLEESQRLDPGGGTLLNLAHCYEGQGKLASAWTKYREALGVARRDGRSDRVGFAELHLEQLKTRVARLQLRVTEQVAGLEIFVDEVKLGVAAWDTAHPVDPGAHRVRATAPGRRPFTAEVRVLESETRDVVIPTLDEDGARSPSEPPPGATQRALGWTLGGVGAAGLATSVVFGFLALSSESTANSTCPASGTCSDPRGLDASTRAHSFATVATIAVACGAALTVGGLVLLLTAPHKGRIHAVFAPRALDGTVFF